MQPSTLTDPPGNSCSEHTPVMLREVLDLLDPKPGGLFVDGTLGLGGHAQGILERIGPRGRLIAVDRDKDSMDQARARLQRFWSSAHFYHDNFKNLPLILNNLSTPPLDGLFLDLGVSSYQLLSPERGFSFQSEAMLDMRMDRTQRLTAADLVNDLPEADLAALIRSYGEERYARRIAVAIARERGQGRISRCSHLAQIVSRAFRMTGHGSIHPATRTFQALRIAVNQELEGLDQFFPAIIPFLKPEGRIVVIAFHSLEDRIVKQAFRKLAGRCVCGQKRELCTCPRKSVATILTPRPVNAGPAEIRANPRARSARLRALARDRTAHPSNGGGRQE